MSVEEEIEYLRNEIMANEQDLAELKTLNKMPQLNMHLKPPPKTILGVEFKPYVNERDSLNGLIDAYGPDVHPLLRNVGSFENLNPGGRYNKVNQGNNMKQ